MKLYNTANGSQNNTANRTASGVVNTKLRTLNGASRYTTQFGDNKEVKVSQSHLLLEKFSYGSVF